MGTAADPRPAVLFVCTHNSARSQMAEGLLRARHGRRYRSFSAGTEARGVHPLAVRVLTEVGVDAGRQSSKTIESLGDQAFDVVVTVCDSAREACPYLPARERNLHHAFRDPSAVEGTEAERLGAFRAVRDEIAAWLDAEFGVEEFVTAPARPADWSGIERLLRNAGLPAADLVAGHVDRFIVARADGAVVGCVAVEPYGEAGLLRSLAVAPDRQRGGLGAQLAEAAEDAARAEGLVALYLLTTTAAPFFQALGYAPAERAAVPEAVCQSSEFAGACPSSAACLAKPLSESAAVS